MSLRLQNLCFKALRYSVLYCLPSFHALPCALIGLRTVPNTEEAPSKCYYICYFVLLPLFICSPLRAQLITAFVRTLDQQLKDYHN